MLVVSRRFAGGEVGIADYICSLYHFPTTPILFPRVAWEPSSSPDAMKLMLLLNIIFWTALFVFGRKNIKVGSMDKVSRRLMLAYGVVCIAYFAGLVVSPIQTEYTTDKNSRHMGERSQTRFISVAPSIKAADSSPSTINHTAGK